MLRGKAMALGAMAVAAVWPAPAHAGWRVSTARPIPVLYNQGVARDPVGGSLYFSGATSERNSGLYRTSSALRPFGGREAVIPPNREGYNHVGDLSFDPLRRRLLLPLECYHPNRGGNTCRRGAIGVAHPATLRLLYRVELSPAQIAKAMWAEISPDGRWVWTSSERRLLVYPASAMNPGLAARQRAGTAPGLVGRELPTLLPSSGVTGAATLPLSRPGFYRLLLSLNRGSYFQVISYAIRTGPSGSPVVAGPARPELSLTRSAVYGEPQGLATTRAGTGALGDRLLWQIVSPASLTARLLTYRPA